MDAAATLLERWFTTRDRLLTSPRFQRWATANPLTKLIARRRARALFDLCAGFVYSQILLACVRLRLFELLREGPRELPDLARRMALSLPATERLLAAAASLQLVARRGGGRYGLGSLGASLLGNPGIAAMVEHHAMLYHDLQDPVALLRGELSRTELADYWPYAASERPASLSAEQVATYSVLMAASQPLIAEQALAAFPLDRYRCLLDVGGGEGAFVTAVGQRYAHLRLMLFDLPTVAERARARLAAAGFGDRVSVYGGDFFSDPLPKGADVVSLVRVIHDHDDDAALAILGAARRALDPGGTLLLAEPMAETPGAKPMGAAYFGFYLLAMGRGRPRTPAQLCRLLIRAGLESPRLVPNRMPLQTRLMAARAPTSPPA